MKTCAKQINLPLSVESKMKLWSILLYLARDWFIKFAPRQQPIGIKAKHNHDWSIVFLPRLWVSLFFIEFSVASCEEPPCFDVRL